MHLTISDVLRQLRTEGLVESIDENAVRDSLRAVEAGDVPWYVRAVAGIGAWLATALLIWFMAAMEIITEEMSALVLGVVFVVAAVVLRRRTTVEFLRHFAVTVSFTGQALLLFGIYGLSDSEVTTAFAAVGLSVALVMLVPDPLHRFLSALGGSIAAVIAVGELRVRHGFEGIVLLIVMLTAWTWRIDPSRSTQKREETLAPVGYGLVMALFGLLLFGTFGDGLGPSNAGRSELWRLGAVTTIGITIALLLLLLAILDEQGTTRSSPRALVYVIALILLGALTLSSPGIVAGAAVLALGFDRRNTILIGLAVLFLLVFGSVYYYSLNLTLLEKSGVLVASGTLLLIVRQVVTRGLSARRTT